MKTRTRLIALLCMLVLLVGVIAVPSAAAPRNNTQQSAESVVEMVETEEDHSFAGMMAKLIAEAANNTIFFLVSQAQRDPNADIEELCRRTEAIARNAIFLISLLGYEAECVYEEYIINGQSVLIDPIIVIKREGTP